MSADRNLRGTELFLARVWLRVGSRGEVHRSADGWGGRVQRVVDGETHEFSDWQGMVDLIVKMLSLDGGQERQEPQEKPEAQSAPD